jgi:pimeloyl-ACP methyl ester carboxylesterase
MPSENEARQPDVAEHVVQVPIGAISLEGNVNLPAAPCGVVLFAHGSGSSRHSPRNRFVASALNQRHIATLLIDLLTPDEDAIDRRTRKLRFDIPLLAERLLGATDWLSQHPDTSRLALGYFGASTGAAAALIAAAKKPDTVQAVVSRGGRADMADDALPRVQVPTLLIVGERDLQVLSLNEQALAQLQATKRLAIVPHATHLFEEPGALESVADLAGDWFAEYLQLNEYERE